jgi:hypothetical protein
MPDVWGQAATPASLMGNHAFTRMVARHLDPISLLMLQRSAGNASVTQLLSRQPDTAEVPTTPGEQAYKSWTKDEIKRIQRELRRLRLYNLRIDDGDLGKVCDQGLVEAFGGDEWRMLDAMTVLERLKAAERPETGKGHDLRYGELFKDGLLDLTFGYGFMEELNATQWDQHAKDIEDALTARGYVEDAAKAKSLYTAAGRKTSGFGRFFVKEQALVYSPPAGATRRIPAIVRFIMNPGGDKGAEAREAFEQGMTQGDAAHYSGHGRYGSGPDFDRNFGKFTLKERTATSSRSSTTTRSSASCCPRRAAASHGRSSSSAGTRSASTSTSLTPGTCA